MGSSSGPAYRRSTWNVGAKLALGPRSAPVDRTGVCTRRTSPTRPRPRTRI